MGVFFYFLVCCYRLAQWVFKKTKSVLRERPFFSGGYACCCYILLSQFPVTFHLPITSCNLLKLHGLFLHSEISQMSNCLLLPIATFAALYLVQWMTSSNNSSSVCMASQNLPLSTCNLDLVIKSLILSVSLCMYRQK